MYDSHNINTTILNVLTSFVNIFILLQVAENVSNFSRISINGWFHCDKESWVMTKQLAEIPSPIYLPLGVTNKVKFVCTKLKINNLFNISISCVFSMSCNHKIQTNKPILKCSIK